MKKIAAFAFLLLGCLHEIERLTKSKTVSYKTTVLNKKTV